MKSVALPVPEIRGVAKLQTPNLDRGSGGHRESGMVLFERALVSSYISPAYILFLYQHPFARNFRLQFSLGVANIRFWGRRSRRGSGMVPFERW